MSTTIDQEQMAQDMGASPKPTPKAPPPNAAPVTTRKLLEGQIVEIDRKLGIVRSHIVTSELEIERAHHELSKLKGAETRLMVEERALQKAMEELDRPDWMPSNPR